MENRREKSLMQCMSWCGVKEMPKEDNGEFEWVRAIGLVSKVNGTQSYVALVRDENGNPKIVRDFGTCALVGKIEKIYPYMLLSSRYVPKFKNDTRKDERIAWLSVRDSSQNWEELTIKELDKKILCVAIQEQLKFTKRKNK